MKRGLRGLARWIWAYRLYFVPGLIALVGSDACQLLVPLFVKAAVDGLASGSANAAYVQKQAAIILVLTAVTVLMRFAWRHFMFSGARLAELELRKRILTHALALPAAYYSKTRTGEVMALATNDLPAIRMALAMGLVAGFDATVFALVALCALAAMDWRLMLWTAIPFPVLGLVMGVAVGRIYHRWDQVQSSFERLTEKARESLAGMRVLRAYAQEEGDQADFERHNADNYEKQVAYAKVDSIFHPAIVALAGMSSAILLGVGGMRVIRGELTLGAFTAFTSYLTMLAWPMIAAGWMLSLVQRGAASMARIDDMLDLPPESGQGLRPPIRGALEAKGVSFTYPGSDRPSLVDVSFRVPVGGSLGLVGEVGSGKSTLATLLARVYDPPGGTLFIDGVDVNDVQLPWLRAHIALVPQEAFLFSEAISENLRLGNEDATDEDVQEVGRLAAIHDEIMEFPRGYDTLLGERGITLSGGQKQRVTLARALLKPSPVLVLDDTLSAVDADTEARILHELQTRVVGPSGRTVVVIAHRISAVRDVDWILVLREGRVVQQGRHEELIAQDGYYRELYELQELAGEAA